MYHAPIMVSGDPLVPDVYKGVVTGITDRGVITPEQNPHLVVPTRQTRLDITCQDSGGTFKLSTFFYGDISGLHENDPVTLRVTRIVFAAADGTREHDVLQELGSPLLRKPLQGYLHFRD